MGKVYLGPQIKEVSMQEFLLASLSFGVDDGVVIDDSNDVESKMWIPFNSADDDNS